MQSAVHRPLHKTSLPCTTARGRRAAFGAPSWPPLARLSAAKFTGRTVRSDVEPQTEDNTSFSPLLVAGLTLLTGSLAVADTAVAAAAEAAVSNSIATAKTVEGILRPLFTFGTLLFIVRVPLTWYPQVDGRNFPWLLVYLPTEPVLQLTRQVIPLVNGVDITPIVWVGVISFLNEILLGPQGIVTLIERGAL